MHNPNTICVGQLAYLGSRQILGVSTPSWVLENCQRCSSVTVCLCVSMYVLLCVCVSVCRCCPCCSMTSRLRTNGPPNPTNQPPRSDLWPYCDHIIGILCARKNEETKGLFGCRLVDWISTSIRPTSHSSSRSDRPLTSHAAHPDRGVRSPDARDVYYVRDSTQGFRATPLLPLRDFERLHFFLSGISSDSTSSSQRFRATTILRSHPRPDPLVAKFSSSFFFASSSIVCGGAEAGRTSHS